MAPIKNPSKLNSNTRDGF